MILSPVGADLLVKELGNDAWGIGISQVMPYPWNDSNPLVREYRKLMTTMGKQSQSPLLRRRGHATKVMVEGIKRAGKDLYLRDKLTTASQRPG